MFGGKTFEAGVEDGLRRLKRGAEARYGGGVAGQR
jgi:hypothetical protein